MKRRIPFCAMLVMLAFAVGVAVAAPAAKAKRVRPAKEAAAREAVVSEPEKTQQQRHEAAPQSTLAISNMANMYYKGLGVPQDYARAMYLYRKAAEQGQTASMITLGYMYEHGQGTKTDYAQAMQWYQKAASLGYANAQKAIGDLYLMGRGVARDDAIAAQWYSKAAEQDIAEAECRLGYLLIRGRGVAKDLVKARTLLEDAAKQNNACAQHYLAFMYLHGMINMLPDTGKMIELEKLAASGGDPEAQYNMGKINEIGWQTYATDVDALHWYKLSASQGYPMAMERMAEGYERGGEFSEKPDPEKARLWRERARAAWAVWYEPRPANAEHVRFMPPK
jgi:TPR repeat protein